MKIEDIDTFTRHYLIAALWSSNDESDEQGGEPLDSKYSLDDIDPDTVQEAFDLCKDFQEKYADLLELAYEFYDENGNSAHPDAGSAQACAGHDLWLTAAGHGVGFWDRGMGHLGTLLTKHAKEAYAPDLYVGDDGKIHSQ